MQVHCFNILFYYRIVERGYYSERDAADALRQICDALAVSPVAINNYFKNPAI